MTSRRRRLTIVWVVLGALAVSIGAMEYHDRRVAVSDTAAERDSRRLLSVPVAQLGAIEIADAGRLHRFERDTSGAWFYHGVHATGAAAHTHVVDPALAERIERAFGALDRARIERQFPLGDDAALYGVATPDVLVLVYRPNDAQPLAQYAIGGVAPDTVSRYVSVVGSRTVVTIPAYQVDNLMGLVQAAVERARAGGGTS